MNRRRGATSLAGIMALDKPAGMTSHDVVAAIRHATGEGRVGHAGTLDPMATGLLVVLIGPYTRLEPYLSGATKSYDAQIAFGRATDTDDTDGETTGEARVPDDVFEPKRARDVLTSFLGPSMQTPPAYSAIKIRGRTAYSAARAGEPLDIPPRQVEVLGAELLGVDPSARTWNVRFVVSKGTYVRALARDIGLAAGTLATLSALRRTASGPVSLKDAHRLEDALAAMSASLTRTLYVAATAALDLPVAVAQGAALAHGRPIPASTAPHVLDGTLASVVAGQRFHGVYRRSGWLLVPEAIIGGDPS